MQETMTYGRHYMYELNEKMSLSQLTPQLHNLFGAAQSLVIQIIALTTDLVEITQKDALKGFWVSRAIDTVAQFQDYGILSQSLAGNCFIELKSAFDLSLRNNFSNKMHRNVPASSKRALDRTR